MFNFRRDAQALAAGHMTPRELYRDRGLWRRVYGLRPFVLPWQVRPYRRETIAPGLILYTAGVSARTLVIGLCGRDKRLFLPVGIILQNLDHQLFDLVTALDTRELHFDRGIEGYADSLPDLARRLSEFADARGYRGVVCYGSSMGGFPALRLGRMICADRAISAGGRFSWSVGRLLRNEADIQAFDALCHCRQPDATESYALFSEGNAEDVESAQRLAAVNPDCRLLPIPHDDHNFPFAIQQARKSDEYYRELFDLTRKPDPAAMRRLVAKRSRLDPRRTFYIGP